MIAEVEVYKGTFPGIMLVKLNELQLASKDVFADEDVSQSLIQQINENVAEMMHTMYRMQSDVTTCELNYELRICAGKIDNPDYVAKIVYEDRLHKIVVDWGALPENFREGTYKCSITVIAGPNLWIRDKNHPLIMSSVDQCKCRAVLNLLRRTGDIEPRPLTLWEHWKQEFRRTFMEDS